jgi:hypothetical protein
MLVGTARCAVRTPQRGAPTLVPEKVSQLPVLIPSLWAESGPTPQCLCLAIGRDETNSFVQPVFLFSLAWEFQQQWDSGSERSRHPAHAFSWIAKQIGPSILPRRVPQPFAFLQASALQARTFSRAPSICVALVLWILKQAVQKAAVFA